MKLTAFFDVLFPPLCIACKKDCADSICRQCLGLVTADATLHCPVCGSNVPLELLHQPRTERCHASASHLVLCAARYEQPVIRALITELKFKRRSEVVEQLGALLSLCLLQSGADIAQYLLLPVPLSAARLRLRGFNQAQLLAEVVAQTLGMDTVAGLVRVKDRAAQSKINSWIQRRVNVAGVYQILPGADLRGKNLIVVDDVYTSGATMSEAVSVLRQAGARDVLGLVVARTSRT